MKLRRIPLPRGKRAVVIGAGSFGTAIAIVLNRAGYRVTLQTRTTERAEELLSSRENQQYLPQVTIPREIRIEPISAGLDRVDYLFLGVPSRGISEVIEHVRGQALPSHCAVVSLAKGLVHPHGAAPTFVISTLVGPQRTAVIGGPAHAYEMVTGGAGLVAASMNRDLADQLAEMFTDGGVVCEPSTDPVGVELAGVAKNAAALAAGATVAQGLNAAGAAAGHIFSEVWSFANRRGAKAESMIGLAGTGDLVATALASASRNRRAGELLGAGVPAREIPDRVGQAVESLDLVPLLAHTLTEDGVQAPITSALRKLIEGELPLEDWVSLVRATVPTPPARRKMARFFRGLFSAKK